MPQQIGEWSGRCKTCGKKIGYSDWSYQKMFDRGHTGPEYCKEHQKDHKEQKAGMGVAYFDLKPNPGTDMSNIRPGWLGSIYHPPRPRVLERKEINFSLGENYGLTKADLREIFDWFDNPQHQVLLAVGETGSGKSTALPICLMFPPEGFRQDQFTRNGQVLITQPRIVATQGIAEHLGNELLNSTTGEDYDIGYRHSKDRNAGWRNRGYFMTDGSLLNILERGELGNVSLIMIDEAHELSENIEAILRALKKQLPLYPHIKLIIASATINEDLFLEAYADLGVKRVNLRARDVGKFGYGEPNFAADEEALPFDFKVNSQGKAKASVVDTASAKTIWLLEEIMKGKAPGDILVFVPGEKEIEGVMERVNNATKGRRFRGKRIQTFRVISKMIQKEMNRLRQVNSDPNYIRVFVGTNVAETSVTINGLVYVIDTGIENQEQWDADLNQKMIVPVTISQANAKQRWGRCGRTRKGEVFCLYTREQFDHFIEFPVPGLKRLPVDNVILTAKAVGLRDDEIRDGWVNTPPQEEIDRATRVLTEKGALSSEGFVTDYGLLLRYFSYPAQLADLIMLADRFGVAIEIATLIPILKNGGRRRLLKWQHGWDAYTKREVAKLHKSLQAGCIDDVEFCLKLYSLWETPYGNDEQNKPQMRESWAKAFFVNQTEMLEVDAERDEIFKSLYGNRKDQNLRPVDLSLVNRVRLVLAFALPEVLETFVPGQPGSYFFETKPDIQEGSSVTGKVHLPSDWKQRLDEIRSTPNSLLSFARWVSYWTGQAEADERSGSLLSRIFIDQAFPVGAIYECEVDPQSGSIHAAYFIAHRDAISEEFRDEVDDYEVPDEDGGDDVLITTLTLDGLRCGYVPTHALEYAAGFVGVVSGYRFNNLGYPIVEFEPEPDQAAFEVFTQNYTAGREVEVQVTGHEVYPDDFKKALIVQEVASGMEILMDPEDLAFTSSPALVEIYPIGARFKSIVRRIDHDRKRVILTMLPYVDVWLRQIVERTGTDDNGQVDVRAVVMDVIAFDDEERTDRVLLNLEWSRPESGVIFTVSAIGKALSKEAFEYEIGERCAVRLQLSTDWSYHTWFKKLPDDLSYLEVDNNGTILHWNSGKLVVKGRISYNQLNELRQLSRDTRYQRALERLYHLSNQITVRKVLDTQWTDRVIQQYPVGTILHNLVVMAAENRGYDFQVDEDTLGFAPRSKSRVAYQVGEVVQTAKVIEVNPDHRNLVLDLNTPENHPMRKYKVGQVITRMVVGSKDGLGAFIEIEPGIDGLLHVKEMPGYITQVAPQYPVGREVTVRIIGIDIERNRYSLSINRL